MSFDQSAIAALRDELDEHLESINQNTTDTQTAFEYVAEVEAKVDKLSEKLDRVLALLNKKEYGELTLREQEVFLALYTEREFMNLSDIAQKLQLPESIVSMQVDSIVQKGVPVLKRLQGSSMQVQIDEEFKLQQAKENVLQLNEFVMSSVAFASK